MSKLYFKFGAMGSSKTANALMTKFNYEEKGNTVWLIKPSQDTRDDTTDESGNRVSLIKSRIGLSATAEVVSPETNIVDGFLKRNWEKRIDVIICDECQFLTGEQVSQMKYIAEFHGVPILCFGLRADFQTHLFEGSRRLFEIADSITEIKSVCKCGKKAIVNARLSPNGEVITEGEQIDIGGNEKYEGMCWGCWQTKIKKNNANN